MVKTERNRLAVNLTLRRRYCTLLVSSKKIYTLVLIMKVVQRLCALEPSYYEAHALELQRIVFLHNDLNTLLMILIVLYIISSSYFVCIIAEVQRIG